MMRDIKDYAHYYIGQPCLNTWFPADHDAYNAGWVLVGFNETSIKPFGLENETDSTWTDSIKPILRRLEDMTEEERQVVHNMGKLYMNHKDHTLPSYSLSKMWAANQTHYLLKQGFDLFGLIDAGLAVDAKTLNQQLK